MIQATTGRARWWGVYAAALAWGVAESTLFFVVPDVLITRVALRSRGHALGCCAMAVVGALFGGALMYGWSLRDPVGLHAALLHVPAVDANLIDNARIAMERLGGWALAGGAFGGVPYKLFAAEAAQAGLSLPVLLVLTVPARGLRFVLLALLTHAAAEWLRPRLGERIVVGVWWLAWIVIYALYWS
jgi:membrane protein YqaA with SNARE-associated domain